MHALITGSKSHGLGSALMQGGRDGWGEEKRTIDASDQHADQHGGIMLHKIAMRPLRAVEEVLFLALLGFVGRGVGVGVGDLGRTAVGRYADCVPLVDQRGRRGREEDVAGEVKQRLSSRGAD